MVELGPVGGTCVNYGCTPTKTMVASAEIAHLARRAPEFGIHAGPVQVDMARLRQRKRDMVKTWREGSEKRLSYGVDLIHGEASFLPAEPQSPKSTPKSILVRLNQGGELRLTADLVVIDTGLTVNPPSIPGLAPGPSQVPFLDIVSIMELDHLPEHLLILGGGHIGLEFGQMFRRFGSRVTIVQRSAQLLPQEDEDIAQETAKLLREDGIEILLSTNAHSVAASPGGIQLTVSSDPTGQVTPATSRTLEGSHLLVATGTPPASTSPQPASSPTTAASSRSTSTSRPAYPASTPPATSTAAPPSPTSPTTTTAYSRPIYAAVLTPPSAAQRTASFPTASSSTLSSAASASASDRPPPRAFLSASPGFP
ncbi:MAG TPA: FAD-dependent oxidoreductase [Granulicella sp.]|jgi:pyruvate/2-oxoglutarate dehydrogenase complex dihydrolipoamide dehydrogenase (E3) component|nr:FAD-dependent oxidoreductase [Granulicella sp.]